MALPRGRRHPHLLRQHRGAQGRLADRRGGRVRDADRLQRRRQVDDAALDLRPHAAAHGLDPLRRRGDLARCRRRRSSGSGICQSPEGRKCFQRMTVRENLELGAYLRRDTRGSTTDLERVFELFPRLRGARGAEGGHDVRRRAADARDRPRADGATRSCCCSTSRRWASRRSSSSASTRRSREINQQGTTILLVEQNANYALDVSKRGYVLETGKVVLTDELRRAARRTPKSRRRTSAHDRSSRSSAPRRCGCSTSGCCRRSSASYLSDRKGYGEKPGLATGLLPHVVGVDHLARRARPSRTRSGRRSAPFGSRRGRAPERCGGRRRRGRRRQRAACGCGCRLRRRRPA